MSIQDNLTKKFLILILVIATGLRLYQIDQNPPSLSWDEAAVGYNAWTIANFGRDEWGRLFPLYFKSFEDDKHPVHVYLTTVSVRILGLTEFATRLPSAVFGVLNVLMIFLLGRQLFKNAIVGLIAALVLTVSPYNIHFSRFSHELNFMIFFFMLGLWLFLRGIEKRDRSFLLSFVGFGLSLLSYHSSKVVVPPIILLLILLYRHDLMKMKNLFAGGLVVLSAFILLITFNPALLGTARIKQTAFSEGDIKKTDWYKHTGNELAGKAEIVLRQYRDHFDPKFLFETGDVKPRLSAQTGEFYRFEIVFLIIGLISLVWQRSRTVVLIIMWALFAPLPSALTHESPHAARAGFMTGSWHLIIAFGLISVIDWLKFKLLKSVVVGVILFLYIWFLSGFLLYYFGEYRQRYAIEWQYGMKQAVEYVKEHPGFGRVYVTDVRAQPYVFFLYYLKVPPSQLLNSVEYNNTQGRSYNLVSSFDKYNFGNWDPIESQPFPSFLYIVSPSQYNGLAHKQEFRRVIRIDLPNGNEGFYIVSAY